VTFCVVPCVRAPRQVDPADPKLGGTVCRALLAIVEASHADVALRQRPLGARAY